MISLKRIFPECDADTLLVQLVLQRGLPVHCKNIHKVASALDKFSNNDLFVIGVIDNDKLKNVPTYIKKFKVHEDKVHDENMAILKLPGTQKYIIRLHPAFEKWVWSISINCGITPSEYGFNKWQDLKSATKTEDVYDNKAFKKFVNAIIQKNPPAIQTLRYWLSKADPEN